MCRLMYFRFRFFVSRNIMGCLRDEDNRIYDIVAGNFFVCDCSTENFKSLSEEQLKRYTEKYKRPERFVQIDDQILAIPMPVKSDKERER